MNGDQHGGLFSRLTTGITWVLVIGVLAEFALGNIVGLFLFLWTLITVVVALVSAWVVNAIAWNLFDSSFTLSDQGWFWITSAVIGGIVALILSADACVRSHPKN